MKRLVREVLVAPAVERYVAGIVLLTVPSREGASPDVVRYVSYGASPRGGQALLLGAKVLALLDGRPHVTCADVDRVAVAALTHRLVMNFQAETAGVDAARIVREVLDAARRLRA